jgi:hypothetical protein
MNFVKGTWFWNSVFMQRKSDEFPHRFAFVRNRFSRQNILQNFFANLNKISNAVIERSGGPRGGGSKYPWIHQ